LIRFGDRDQPVISNLLLSVNLLTFHDADQTCANRATMRERGSGDVETVLAMWLNSSVSAFALIVDIPLKSAADFAKCGTRLQRIRTSSRSPVFLALRMTGWNVVGATL
jgi:hypothetical protein